MLHRDISVGNVLLYPRPEEVVVVCDGKEVVTSSWALGGMLIDWELAKPISMKEPRQPERTVRLAPPTAISS